jgi:hypothetical protein
MNVYMYHSKTNEISFTTHHLDIAYHILTYHITLWFLFSSPCQTWWWPYNKRAETCCHSSDSYILIKLCYVLTYPPCHSDLYFAHSRDEPPRKKTIFYFSLLDSINGFSRYRAFRKVLISEFRNCHWTMLNNVTYAKKFLFHGLWKCFL